MTKVPTIDLPREQVSAYVVVGVVVLCSLVVMWVLDARRQDDEAQQAATEVVSPPPAVAPTTGPTLPPVHPGGRWSTVADPIGRYAFDFPGVPVVQAGSAPGESTIQLGDANAGWFRARVVAAPAGTAPTSFEQAYTAASKELADAMGRQVGGVAQVTPTGDTTLLGMPARTVTVSVNRSGTAVTLPGVIASDGVDTVVLVAGGGPFAEPDPFFASAQRLG